MSRLLKRKQVKQAFVGFVWKVETEEEVEPKTEALAPPAPCRMNDQKRAAIRQEI